MKIIITNKHYIFFEEKGVNEDRFAEILEALKTFDNKENYDLFVRDGAKFESINVADIFD